MHILQFKREPNYRNNQYAILEFKGKFQSESDYGQTQLKSLVHLGELKQTKDGKYKLEIGVMDLVGKEVKLGSKQIVTETISNMDGLTKTVLVKGMITKKIVFENRPAPDMERVVNVKRDSVNHKMFSKVQERQQQQQLKEMSEKRQQK